VHKLHRSTPRAVYSDLLKTGRFVCDRALKPRSRWAVVSAESETLSGKRPSPSRGVKSSENQWWCRRLQHRLRLANGDTLDYLSAFHGSVNAMRLIDMAHL
jgi:hypothetical protein